MKREPNDLDFFQCPVVEVGDMRTARGILETGLPLIPSEADGIKENAVPVSGNAMLRKALKIAGIIVLAVLFIVMGVGALTGLY